MAEWINLYNASKISGFSAGWISKLIRRGSLPPEQTRRSGHLWYVTIDAAEWLRQLKESNPDWTCNELPEPIDAVHVADPLGIYPGLILPPDAAARLLEIRANFRRYGYTRERYAIAMRIGDG